MTRDTSDLWQSHAELKTYGEAVADVIEFRIGEGDPLEMTVEEWLTFQRPGVLCEVRGGVDGHPRRLGPRAAKTPEGYYQVQGGLDYAIAKSLAAAPFADLLWMETKTANLEDARGFADAIHAEYPDKMLAYNLSPSFNWDTTGMTDDQMRRFPEARAARVRLQLHHLRRPSDRRPGRRGIHDRAAAGRDAGAGAVAAQVATCSIRRTGRRKPWLADPGSTRR